MIGSLLVLLGCSGQEKKTTETTEDEIQKSLEDFQNRPIYKKLTAELIEKIKDEELEQSILDNISANIAVDQDEKEIIRTLTSGQRAIFVTSIVEGEVNNGGFNQFYFNSSGQLADVGEESFKAIGATKFAELMKEANSIYNKIRDDLKKYDDGTTESFSKSYKDNPLNALDDRFYKLSEVEPLSKLKIKFIRDNVKQFVTE